MSNPEARPGVQGLARLWRATRYSLDGIRAAFANEAAFRQELALAALSIPVAVALAVYSPITWTQCALMIACVLLILLVELLNSAIESVVDRISHERHALSKRAKDTGSAAVLVSLLMCAVVWALILVDAFT